MDNAPGLDAPIAPRQTVEWHVIAVLALLALLIGFMPLPWDPDLWFHLADGRFIAQQHTIPQADPFSFTRQGELWVPHSWLFDLGTWLGWQYVSPRATEAAMAVVFMATALVSFWIMASRGMNPLLALGLCLVLAISSANTRGIRPQVFSLLFSNLTILLLVQHCHKPGRRLLILLPLLFLLWSQIHGASVMGLLLVAVWIAGRAWEALLSQSLRRHQRELAIGLGALVLSVLAVWLTPHRTSLYSYMLLTMNLKALKHTTEWQPTQLLPVSTPDICLYLLIVALFILMARRGRQISWAPLGLSTALILLGTTANRHVSLACMGAVPLLTELLAPGKLTELSARMQWSWKSVLTTSLIAAGLLAALWRHPEDIQARYARKEPIAGCKALCEFGQPLRVFTTHNTGSYVLFANPRLLKVFADSRPDVYGDKLFFQGNNARAGRDWQATFKQWPVEAAVLQRSDELANILKQQPDWVLLAEDPAALTFIRSERLTRR